MSNCDDRFENVCDDTLADLNSKRLNEAAWNLRAIEDQLRDHVIEDQNKIIGAHRKIIEIQADEIARLRKQKATS